jgi:hypothetical protein
MLYQVNMLDSPYKNLIRSIIIYYHDEFPDELYFDNHDRMRTDVSLYYEKAAVYLIIQNCLTNLNENPDQIIREACAEYYSVISYYEELERSTNNICNERKAERAYKAIQKLYSVVMCNNSIYKSKKGGVQ